MTYEADSSNVQLIGRTFTSEGARWCGLSGSGVAFRFTGTRLSLTLMGDNTTQGFATEGWARIGVYIDNTRVIDMMLEQPHQELVLIDKGERTEAEVRIIKLSECPMSMFGIESIETDEEGHIEPLPGKLRKIEIIGDSITCGYGVDEKNMEAGFSTASEDVTKSYSYQLAKRLDADYSMVSFSGYGIISGYTDTDVRMEKQCVPLYYESLGYSDATIGADIQPQNIKWNFRDYVPDMILINLGTNDDSYCQDHEERQAEFTELYIEFLEQVRRCNPQATILCVIGTMAPRIYGAVKTAVEEYRRQSGDLKIHEQMLPEQLPEDGNSIDGHPSIRTHEKTTEILAAAISKIMNW